MVAVMYFS